MPSDAQVEAFGRKYHGAMWDTEFREEMLPHARAALEAAEAAAWQTIDKAPRDGTPVDLWATHKAFTGRLAGAHWNGRMWEWGGAELEQVTRTATHWRPLPEPPRSE